MTDDSRMPPHQIEMARLSRDMPPGLREVLELVPGWFWTTCPDHRFTWFSPGFEAYTGDPSTQFIGRSRVDVLRRIGVGEDLVARHLADLEAHRPFENFVYPTVYTRGETWLSIGGTPVTGPDGAFAGYRGIAIPIDAVMSRAEAAMPTGDGLRARAEKLQRTLRERTDALGDAHALMLEVVEGIDQGLLVTSGGPTEGGRVLMVNERFYELTGMPRSAIGVGTPVADLLRMMTSSSAYGATPEAVAATHARIMSGEACLLPGASRSGRRLLVRRSARAAGGAVSTVTDVTAMEAARRTAADAAAARAAFLSSMSHEFRTPMNGVLGMAEVLAEGLPDGEMRDCAAVMQEAAADLARMLDEVIDYADALGADAKEAAPAAPRDVEAARAAAFADARPAGRMGPCPGRSAGPDRGAGACDLTALAREALMAADEELGRRGLDVRLTVDADFDPIRQIDAPRLRRALRALVAEAAESTRSGGIAIRIEAATELRHAPEGSGDAPPPEVRIEVIDAGPGELAAPASGEAPAPCRTGGPVDPGPGLSLARRLALEMGGWLATDEMPDGGTRAALILPAPLIGPEGFAAPSGRSRPRPGSAGFGGLSSA